MVRYEPTIMAPPLEALLRSLSSQCGMITLYHLLGAERFDGHKLSFRCDVTM